MKSISEDEGTSVSPRPCAVSQMAEIPGANLFPVILIDRSTRVLATNPQAEEMLASGNSPLAKVDDQLTFAANPPDDKPFANRIAALRPHERQVLRLDALGDTTGMESPNWLVLDRSGPDTIAVSLRNICDIIPKQPHMLGDYLSLTPSESQLLCALTAADTLVEYAQRCEREPSTIRWHMRNLLSKTQCRSKRELLILALLLTI